jgi:hypothetical protein
MHEDKFLTAQAREIRRMAFAGYGFKAVQSKLRVSKKELMNILESYYTERNRNKILEAITSNEQARKNAKKRKEVIVLDTSYLIQIEINELEKFILANDNVIVPGPVLSELHTNSDDENKNFTSRRILTVLLELDVKVEVADSSIQLDPTWVKNKDYYILTVCAKLINQGYDVKLLSFDKEMILKARGIGAEMYPMEFPQENVKHCNSYSLIQNIKEDNAQVVTEESLEALKEKFNSSKGDVQKEKTPKPKANVQVRTFEKPHKFQDIQLNEDIPELKRDEGGEIRLIDNSSIDLLMGILKTVINNSGKLKELQTDEDSSYFEVDEQDEVIIFTKLSNIKIEMKVGSVDENLNFVQNNILLLEEGGMKKVSKKYHAAIKEAFYKLLKIKLKKVS